MNDAPPVKTHTDLQPIPVPAPAARQTNFANGIPAFEEGYEDAEIRCVCGYDDDDGNTVLCEKCMTWQHILCYYGNRALPEDFDHFCVNCEPREIDRAAAIEKQRRWRESQATGERRKKQPSTKSHKKKVKESSANPPSLNGWSDTAGSPRDQQPPAKRPKTNHRASTSLASASHPLLAPRKRAESVNVAGHSPAKSPSLPLTNGQAFDFVSPEFVALCQEPLKFAPIDANNYSSIAVYKELLTWLEDPEALAAVTKGKKPQEVMHSYLEPFQTLEDMAPQVVEVDYEVEHVTPGGYRPKHKLLRTQSPVAEGAYIGELRGKVGRKDDYIADVVNRWQRLHHPEPFVFFPPHLPVYIDARVEGTRMRYVRRSCDPNVRMQIIIVDKSYHFCLVADRHISEGEELTIKWDIPEEIVGRLAHGMNNGTIRNQGMRAEDIAMISEFASCLFANFGGCACQGLCVFDRFDRRSENHLPISGKHSGKRTKKVGNHISPPSTGRAVNSRAGSEALNHVDQDDDDSRSFSGSTHSKPSSRDITPSTHSIEHGFGLGSEMTEREKRKIQQQEERFKQMEEHNHHKRGKKRNSGGSTLNTPSINTSKQLGGSDSADPSPTISNAVGRARMNGMVRSHNLVPGRESSRTVSNGSQRSVASSGRRVKAQPPPKPVYVDCAVQTDTEPPALSPVSSVLPLWKKGTSYKEGLFGRLRVQRQLREQESARKPTAIESKKEVMTNGEKEDKESVSSATMTDSKVGMMLPPPLPAHASVPPSQPEPVHTPSPSEDVEMKDADEPTSEPVDTPMGDSPVSGEEPDIPADEATKTSHPPPQPPPPPWPSGPIAPVAQMTSPTLPSPPDKRPSPKLANMHVKLPPPPAFPAGGTLPNTPSINITPDLNGVPVVQSPSALTSGQAPVAPMFPPAIANIAEPAKKKKMSLSDYTRRKSQQAAASATTVTQNSTITASPELGALAATDAMRAKSPLPPLEPVRQDVEMPLAPPGSAPLSEVKT